MNFSAVSPRYLSSYIACECPPVDLGSMNNQAQPVRTGDVYPPTAAAKREASHERDKITREGQQRGGDLHVEETTLPAGRRMVTASAGGQVRFH